MAISRNYKPDFLVWHHTNSGRYTVKSGYRLAMALSAEEDWGPNCKALQAHAWKLKVPPRISHFMWQVASGALAVTSELQHRGVSCEIICKRCGSADETINHTLFECPHSLSVWKEFKIPLIQGVFPSSSVFSNLDFLYWRLPSHTNSELIRSGFPWIMWYIWKDRNKKVFEGTQSESLEILNLALSEKIFWEEAQVREDEEAEEIEDDTEDHVDNNPTLKCQIDGSWKGSDPTTGLGWVCSWGPNQIVVMGAGCQRRSLSPLHSELEALIWAMKTIILRRIDCQAFETDCAELVSMVQSPEDWPAFSTILEEFGMLRAQLPLFSISCISRLCNVRADCLARSSRTLFSECFYVNSSPPVWATNRGVVF